MADAPVVVVGAGPVGMTAALALRARGLPVVVIEQATRDTVRPGSRAIFYHRQTMELWDGVVPGLGGDIARTGLVWSTKRTFWRERQVYERTYAEPPAGALPHSTNLAQRDVERMLRDSCESAGVVFVWSSEVADVATSESGVAVHATSGKRWDASYVVAADGSRSAVRQAIGVDLEGSRSANSFVIVDVAERETEPLRPERRYHYEHPAVDGRNVLLVPFAGGWRVDLQLRAGDEPDRFNQPDAVAGWLRGVLPPDYADRVTWVSTYQFLQVVASAFTDEHRRVLLTGEAAHLFAPFGARGLNSGARDAVTAAAAIAATLGGDATAIARFADDRRNAALYNREAAGLALEHMLAGGVATRWKRSLAARAAVLGNRAGSWLDSSPFGPRAAARRSDAI